MLTGDPIKLLYIEPASLTIKWMELLTNLDGWPEYQISNFFLHGTKRSYLFTEDPFFINKHVRENWKMMPQILCFAHLTNFRWQTHGPPSMWSVVSNSIVPSILACPFTAMHSPFAHHCQKRTLPFSSYHLNGSLHAVPVLHARFLV